MKNNGFAVMQGFIFFNTFVNKMYAMDKKVSAKEFKKQKQIARNKLNAVDELIKKGILTVDFKDYTATVNYLLWHSYSKVGLIHFAQTLFFYCKINRAYNGLEYGAQDVLHVSVDYGKEDNEYEKLGVVQMVEFNDVEGFIEIN